MNNYESELTNWIGKEKLAIQLINEVGQLWYDKSVELVIFRKPLVDQGASEILNHHLYAQRIADKDLNIENTVSLAKSISKLDLAPSRIDIGRLGSEWIDEQSKFDSIDDFTKTKLKSHLGKDTLILVPKDVILYGFGRIGRIAARELITQAGKGEQLRLRAIVTRTIIEGDIQKRADLLRNDSIHGAFKGTITADEKNQCLIINGQTIHLIAAKNPTDIDYTEYGINNALVIDNTGVWRDQEGLSKHLEAKGTDKVLLTAPGKGDVPNIVYGVNNHDITKENTIFSAASCTTNAISPVLNVVQSKYGIEKGHIETVHAYTNDQNLLDNYHSKYRRGRAAGLNMVITETGAAKAVSKVLPVLSGKLTGNAVRVPTPDVSLAILHLTLSKEIERDEINATLKNASLFGEMVEQIEFSISNELVSSDIVGNSHASIVDGPATIVSVDKRNVVLYVWYDNEYGYTRQVIRLAKRLADVIRLRYY
ncbi:MAG: glyceraldehyde 3-phosphate dehydrogenase [Sphingobacteriales bacterium]|jgi:glyceraldehyde 3-phosphate dehydrogenase